MPAAPCGHVAFAPVHVRGAPIAYPSARNRITRPAPRFYSVVTNPNGTHQNDRKKEIYPLDRISAISTLEWWHGGAGLTERSERGSLSAVATHDLFGDSVHPVGLSVLPESRRNASASWRMRLDLCTIESITVHTMGIKSPTRITMSGRSLSIERLIDVATSNRIPYRRIRMKRSSRVIEANFSSEFVSDWVSFIAID